MSKGGYRGGSTIVRPGTTWFSGEAKRRIRDLGTGKTEPISDQKSELEKRIAATLKANRAEARRAAAAPASLEPKLEQKRQGNVAVWAMLFLSEDSERNLREFFIQKVGVPGRFIQRDMHLTIYHARRPLRGLLEGSQKVDVVVPASELRFMTMAPGGENARSDIDPSKCQIGLRVRRAEGATAEIERLRALFYGYETDAVIGSRSRSGRRESAFGARNYQPHVTVLKPGAPIDPDLSQYGALLRQTLEQIRFDKFTVKIRHK
jgi:hypothetical protein